MKKNIFIILLLALRIGNIFALNSNAIDSLEQIIKTQKKDTIYINSAIKLVSLIRYSDINRAEELIKESLQLSQKLNYKTGIALSKLNYGTIYHIKGDYVNAEKNYLEAVDLFKQLKRENETAKCYNNLGNLYQLKSDYEKALNYLLLCESISEKIGNKKGISDAELNIGNIYMQKRDYQIAINHFNLSLNITKQINDITSQAQALNNLGATYRLMNRLDTALTFYQNSLLLRKKLNDKIGTAENLLNIGDVYFNKQLSDSALIYFKRAYFIYKELNHKLGIAYCNNNLGTILFSKKLYNAALDSLISASIICKELGALDLLAEAYKNIAETYFKTGNYKQSAIYRLDYSKLRDTILNEQNQKQIAEMQTKFETEKKEKEILLLNQDKIIRDADLLKKSQEVQKQKIIIYAFILGFIIIITFSLLLYKQFQAKKTAYFKLEKKNIEIQQKNEEISAQRDEIESQRDEIMAQRDLVTQQKNEIEEIHEKVTSSIRYAERIQHAMLPTEEMSKMLLANHFILFKPRDIVSGDFYWTMIKKEWLYIAVADCTGHGVPGAFMSMLGISLLNEIIARNETIKANQILENLRELIIKSLKQNSHKKQFLTENDKTNNYDQATSGIKDGMDISLVVINLENYHMQFSGANNPVYIVRKFIKSESETVESGKWNEANFETLKTSELYELKGDKMPIAIYERMSDYVNHEINLQKGDIFYLTSDGYADQFGGPENKKILKKQLKNILSEISSLEMYKQKEVLEHKLNEWKGKNDQTDDITIVGVKI